MDQLAILGVKIENPTLSYFMNIDETRKEAISACLKLVQMWADITLVY
jgi:hypothetical protein